MTPGGDIANDDKVPGLLAGGNVLFNNPWTFLPPGTTAERPAPSAAINYRLRFNTDDQLYEYYDAVLSQWTQLQESLFTAGPFLIYEADPAFPDAFNLGGLTSGILKQTVTLGVSTPAIAINGADYYGPGYAGFIDAPAGFKDSSGNITLQFLVSPSAVNYLTIANAIATGGPVISAQGTDTNIRININPKGNESVVLNTSGTNQPLFMYSGTAFQHLTIFEMADTLASRTATWQDSDGTVAWLSDVMGTVTSIEGTDNQVFANGTFGSPVVGDIILTLPQDIATASSPEFANITLSGASQIRGANGLPVLTVLSVASAVNSIVANNQISGSTPSFSAFGSDTDVGIGFVAQAAGVYTFSTTASTALQYRTGTAYQHLTNFIFANTANTCNVTWQDASGTVAYLSDVAGAVTSITGTANQILANATSATPQTGAVTLTLPSTLIAPGTIAVGNILLDTNTLSITNSNGNLNLLANGTGMVLLNNNTSVTISGVTPTVEINNTTGGGLLITRFINSAASPSTLYLKSRGTTINSLGAVQNGDTLAVINFYADDGSTYNTIAAEVDVTVTASVSTGIVPAQYRISTMDTSGVLRTALAITNDQHMILGNPLQLAYGGTNAILTASNGGIVYSTASAMAILSGTATANLPLLSGSTAAPSWGAFALSLGGALTTAGALTTSGAFGATFTFTNTTSVTFPTSGTLATTSQIPSGAALTKTDDTNVTLTLGGSPSTALVNAASLTLGWTGTLSGTRGGTGVNNGASTITLGGSLTTSGAFASTFTMTGITSVTFPTSGTLATTAQLPTPAALTKTDDTNVTLTLGGTPTTALLQATSLTLGWTGQLGLTRGGTNASLTASNGGIIYSTASAMAVLAGTATAGQMLQSGASTTPAWSTTTYPATNAVNTLLYASSANVMAALATANSSVLVTSAGGVPSFSTALPSGLTATNMNLTTPTLGVASATSINFGGGALASYVPKTSFTPTFTFATPGDLSVSYASQVGLYERIGNVVTYQVILTCTPTFTTASGAIRIGGLPITVLAGGYQIYNNIVNDAALVYTGTSIYAFPNSGQTYITISQTKTATGESSLTTTALVTGVAITLKIFGSYFV